MFKIGWFSTGNGKGSRDLLKTAWQAIQRGEISNTEISFVFCNRKYGESPETDKFLNLAEELKMSSIISLSSDKFSSDLITIELKQKDPEKWREEYDRIVLSFLAPCQTDLYFLAGYKRIISPLMCKAATIINLHPAKPGGPKGTWQEVIRQIIKNRERESGVTIHVVAPELDAGPPIAFCKYRIKEYDFDKIRQQGLKREFPLIIETLKLLALGEIDLSKLTESRDLTKVVNKKIKSRRQSVTFLFGVGEFALKLGI